MWLATKPRIAASAHIYSLCEGVARSTTRKNPKKYCAAGAAATTLRPKLVFEIEKCKPSGSTSLRKGVYVRVVPSQHARHLAISIPRSDRR